MTRSDRLALSEVDALEAFDPTGSFLDSEILSRDVEEPLSWLPGVYQEIAWTCKEAGNETECIDPAEIFQSTARPSVPFVEMIREAISESKKQRLYLREIYEGIMSKYAYYRNNPHNGWKVDELKHFLHNLF